MDVREQIEDYLELLDFKYSWNSENEEFELIFSERKDEKPAQPEPDESDEYFRYTIKIIVSSKWVQVFADVYSLSQVPEDKRADVLVDLLTMNRKYAEVCFDYDEKNEMIGTSQEMLITGLNFDLFRGEFLSIPWAVKRFWTEIATKHNLA